MKIILTLQLITANFLLLCFPWAISGQTAPRLGTASGFALFTAAGAFDNAGTTSSTQITGSIGSNTATPTGFPPGIVYGSIFHTGDIESAQAASDIAVAYSDLSAVTCSTIIGVALGNDQVLTPGVYCQGAASTLSGNIYLDAGGNPDALFMIKIGGAFATSAFSNVILINSASLCNVYWQINGQFDLGDNSVFRGNLVVNGAINLLDGSSLFGRVFSTAGAISLHNNLVTPFPLSTGTITGNTTVCLGQTGVGYSVPLITNATGYIWTLPSGATIISGNNTNSIIVSFSEIASSGNITVKGSNSCGTGTVSADYSVTVNPLPPNSTIFHE
ncbi:MAG: ice-binding family protein [Bacteroidetes bacterium]|nr:ice-binding family protein [Bacteroidota bacterium]